MWEGAGHTGAVLVCNCEAVNDQRIVEEAISGACDVDAVARRCGAGSQCGGCHPTIEALLAAFGLADQPAA